MERRTGVKGRFQLILLVKVGWLLPWRSEGESNWYWTFLTQTGSWKGGAWKTDSCIMGRVCFWTLSWLRYDDLSLLFRCYFSVSTATKCSCVETFTHSSFVWDLSRTPALLWQFTQISNSSETSTKPLQLHWFRHTRPACERRPSPSRSVCAPQ